MKLEYKILWFDDSKEIFESLPRDYLEEQIANWGFIPKIDFVTNSEEFVARSPYKEYDLLVVDYNLEESGEGQQFIQKVREQEVYTEIIFYSSGRTSNLWDAVREHQLEGIYIANKDGIIERIIKVGQQTLRKVLDVENMRGIVMAEVGDLDHLLDAIVRSAMEGLSPEQKQDVFDRFHQASDEFHGKYKEKLDTFKATPSVEVLLTLCDSNKRWQNYNRAKGHHPALKAVRLGDYEKEILSPRNFLAHGVPEPGEEGVEIFRYQGKTYAFSEEIAIALRKKIIEYKLAFSGLSKELAGQLAQVAIQKAIESGDAAA